jgi:anti-sigma B factor antagonist
VKGEVDVYTAPKLREEIGSQVKGGNYRIVVDLSHVDFMDSTGLAVLISGLKRVKDHDGALALVTTKDPVLRVLSLTGLDKLFSVYATVEEAAKI